MRKKEKKLVITFNTTQAAMAMEAACRTDNIPGRIIPVPGFIKAGCGLAWCIEPSLREELVAFMKQKNINYDGIYQAELF